MQPLNLFRLGHAPHPAQPGEYCPQTYGLGAGQRLSVQNRAAFARSAAEVLARRSSSPGTVKLPSADRRPPG